MYIELLAEVDSEELISSMEYIISEYKGHIAPFSAGLLQTFMRSFESIIQKDSEDSIAAWECLRAIKLVLHAISEDATQFATAEKIIVPTMKQFFTVDNEYFEDFLHIIATLATHSDGVSDDLWSFFPIISEACLVWALDYMKGNQI